MLYPGIELSLSAMKIVEGDRFKRPLNSILALTELLQCEPENNNTEHQLTCYRSILENTRQMIYYSERIRSCYLLLQMPVFHNASFLLTPELIGGVIEKEANKYLINGEMFHVSVQASPCRVLGDEYRIRLALKEIVNNAFKFSAKDRLVSVSVFCRDTRFVVKVSNYFEMRKEKAENAGEHTSSGLGLELATYALSQCGAHLSTYQGMDSEIVIEVVLLLAD